MTAPTGLPAFVRANQDKVGVEKIFPLTYYVPDFVDGRRVLINNLRRRLRHDLLHILYVSVDLRRVHFVHAIAVAFFSVFRNARVTLDLFFVRLHFERQSVEMLFKAEVFKQLGIVFGVVGGENDGLKFKSLDEYASAVVGVKGPIGAFDILYARCRKPAVISASKAFAAS